MALPVAGSPAGAKIKPGKGIAGVKIGMSKADVVAKKGEPSNTESGSNDFGPYETLEYGPDGKKLTVTITMDQVTMVRTAKPKQKTSSGVGVGSTKKQVKNGVSGVVCGKQAEVPKACQVDELLPGNIVTVFRLESKKVKMVEVGLVID